MKQGERRVKEKSSLVDSGPQPQVRVCAFHAWADHPSYRETRCTIETCSALSFYESLKTRTDLLWRLADESRVAIHLSLRRERPEGDQDLKKLVAQMAQIIEVVGDQASWIGSNATHPFWQPRIELEDCE